MFSSYNDWVTLFGDANWSYQVTPPLSLWYVQNDGVANFDGYQAFGGWTSPSIKRYSVGSTLCDISSNLDYIGSNSDLGYIA